MLARGQRTLQTCNSRRLCSHPRSNLSLRETRIFPGFEQRIEKITLLALYALQR